MSNETKQKRHYKGCLVCESSSNGYPTIWINGKNTLVHRLVWEDANGAIPDDMEIHHKDHNKMNYSLDNLVMLPKNEHHRHHALKYGLGKDNKGKPKKHQSGCIPMARAILAVKDSQTIKFDSISQAARELKTNADSIWRVLSGKRKQNHGWRFEYVNA